jgi:nucleoside-diphosphate-sugar epimerase
MSDPANTRILVTGGTGFIGRYVVDFLKADGYSPLVSAFNKKNIDPEIIPVDVTDSKRVEDLVQNYRPQIVLHLAGVTPAHRLTSEIYENVNYLGTVNLLNALESNGVDRVILLGSASEYGNQPTPFCESMSLRPASPYAISKVKANEFALRKCASSGLPVTILRIFTAYGHGQPDKMFLSQLLRHARLNHRFKMSDGEQKRDFVHIDDVVGAVKTSMTAENAVGRAINVAGGRGVRLRDVARKAWELCDADRQLLDIGGLEKSGDDRFDTEADISLASEILNWRPGPGILSEADDYSRLRDTIRKMTNDVSSSAGR